MTDGQTGERTDGGMDRGRTGGQRDRQRDGQSDRRRNGLTNRWTDRPIDKADYTVVKLLRIPNINIDCPYHQRRPYLIRHYHHHQVLVSQAPHGLIHKKIWTVKGSTAEFRTDSIFPVPALSIG